MRIVAMAVLTALILLLPLDLLASCVSLDSDPLDDLTPIYCSYQTFEEAEKACALKSSDFGQTCYCDLKGSEMMQLCCGDSVCQIGVPGMYYEYYFKFPPMELDAAQVVLLATVAFLTIFGFIAGLFSPFMLFNDF